MQTERDKTWALAFIKAHEWSAWGSWAEAELITSNQKSRVLVSPTGVPSKGCIRRTGAGRLGRLDHKGCWGGHIRDLHLLVTLWAAIQGMHWHEGLASILGPCRPLDQIK